ncbi:MAG: NADH-quinone oxidoreductase subunit K, partial [Myxococcota bacterium]
IGFMLISNAINLLIFVAGRFTRGEPPIVHGAAHGVYANPLPQALILTAIVISFGITAFAFSLTYRVFKSLGTLDTDSLVEVERLEPVHDEEELSA